MKQQLQYLYQDEEAAAGKHKTGHLPRFWTSQDPRTTCSKMASYSPYGSSVSRAPTMITRRPRSPESYASLAKRTMAVDILRSYEQLSWWSFKRAEVSLKLSSYLEYFMHCSRHLQNLSEFVIIHAERSFCRTVPHADATPLSEHHCRLHSGRRSISGQMEGRSHASAESVEKQSEARLCIKDVSRQRKRTCGSTRCSHDE